VLFFWIAGTVVLLGLALAGSNRQRSRSTMAWIVLAAVAAAAGLVGLLAEAMSEKTWIGVVAGLLFVAALWLWVLRRNRAVDLTGIDDPVLQTEALARVRAHFARPRPAPDLLAAARRVAFAGLVDEARQMLVESRAALTTHQRADRAVLFAWIHLRRGEFDQSRQVLDDIAASEIDASLQTDVDFIDTSLLAFQGRHELVIERLDGRDDLGAFAMATLAHARMAGGDEGEALAVLGALADKHGKHKLRAALTPIGPATAIAQTLLESFEAIAERPERTP
jgi:hypothetical protein